MALINLKFYSAMLGKQTEVLVVMPQRSTIGEIGVNKKSENVKYKCLYLLHGLSDDFSIWSSRTSIERYATEYGLCVVMPDGGKSFYTDMKYGDRYYSYISKELPQILGEFLNVSEKREDNFIAGLSMGGYGALKIGMKNCDRFSASAGLSSVADIKSRKDLFPENYLPIFGDDLEIPDEEDLFKIAQTCNQNPQKPKIYIGVGTEDFLYQDNVKLKEKFEEMDFDFTYKESSGTHCWEFWDEYIQYVLEWIFK